MKTRDKTDSKKPYHRPRLVVYGDLGKLTQALGFMGKADNPTKTLKLKS